MALYQPTLRLSPSGYPLDFAITTDDLENRSIVPGQTVSSALTRIYQKRVEYLDVEDDPLALWNFNDTLAAVRGPSLSLGAGTFAFTDVYPGVRGLEVAIGCRLDAPLTPNLQLQGDMSVEMLLQLDTSPTACWMCGVGGTSSVAAAQNASWGLMFPNATVPRGIQGFWQSGSGVARGFTTATTSGNPSLPPIHMIMTVGFSRSGIDGIPYLNGRAFGPPISGVAAPTAGTSGIFTIGARPGATCPDQFLVLSIAVYNRVRPASEWLGSFNRSIGNGLGFTP